MFSQRHQQCFDINASAADVKKCVREGHHVFVLMRGVSGSGKSTIVKDIVSVANNYIVYSSDDANFQNVTKNVRSSLIDGISLVIVDADNEERAIIKKLGEIAITNSYELFVISTIEQSCDISTCLERSTRKPSQEDLMKKLDCILDTPISMGDFFKDVQKHVQISNTHSDDEDDYTPSPSSSGSLTTPSPSSLSPIKAATTTSPSQIISLAPGSTGKLKRQCSTQLVFSDVARNMADLPESAASGFWDEGITSSSAIVERESDGSIRKAHTKERCIQSDKEELVGGDSTGVEYSMLCAMFPISDKDIIRHYLQVFGYSETFSILESLREHNSQNGLPQEQNGHWMESEHNESFTESKQTIEDEMEERANEYRIIQRLQQQYEETSNDEMLALIMQQEEDSLRSVSSSEDDAAIRYLKTLFPAHSDDELLRGFYNEQGRNIDATRAAIRKMFNVEEVQGVPQYRPRTWNRRVAAQHSTVAMLTAHMTPEQKRNRFLKDLHKKRNTVDSNMNEAHRYAITAHRELLTTKNQNGSAKRQLHDSSERFRAATQKKIAEVDRKLSDAHQNPWCLDLHYMSVDGATKLVQEAIDAVKYHLRQDNNVPTKITVITGKGNNSRHGARIKPAVIKHLQNHGIAYKCSGQNEGCVEVTVRK